MKALVILTPSESKRLIAKAVASMDIVKDALKNGIVVIIKGTTNSYVAEEILGRKIDKGRYARGIVTPERLTSIPGGSQIPDVILEMGKVREDLALGPMGKGTQDVFEILKAGDVIIKGGERPGPQLDGGNIPRRPICWNHWTIYEGCLRPRDRPHHPRWLREAYTHAN